LVRLTCSCRICAALIPETLWEVSASISARSFTAAAAALGGAAEEEEGVGADTGDAAGAVATGATEATAAAACFACSRDPTP
jgi:hypothetical protein